MVIKLNSFKNTHSKIRQGKRRKKNKNMDKKIKQGTPA